LNDNHYGKEALDTIVSMVNNAAGDDIAICMCGYEGPMKQMLLDQNPGLARRFPITSAFHFEDFTNEELRAIVLKYASSSGFELVREAADATVELLAKQRARPNFGNAGAVVGLMAKAQEALLLRDAKSRTITLADVLHGDGSSNTASLRGSVGEILDELDVLHNIGFIKDHLIDLQQLYTAAKEEDDDPHQYLNNYVFTGPPGTGKTTVARKMARMLNAVGLLSNDEFVEVSAADLLGSYLGQTKDKVNDAFRRAAGGLLFIDEAYSLLDG
jgi:predicted kinase